MEPAQISEGTPIAVSTWEAASSLSSFPFRLELQADPEEGLLRHRPPDPIAPLVRAGHDCSDGGLAVALAEMAFSGEVGLEVDLAAVPVVEDLREDEVLFSESASRLLVEVKPRDVPAFEDIMGDGPWAGIGRCTAGKSLDILSGERQIMSLDLTLMKRAWQRTLREL